jgi:hypothetical protein
LERALSANGKAMPKCEHTRKAIVWSKVNSHGEPFDGGQQLRHQCQECGKLLPNHLPHRLATAETPDVDLVALKRCREREEQRWKDQVRFWDEKRERERAEWFEKHNEYLLTDKWQEKREAVLAREDNLCQGCRSALAVHIHHLSYENWGDELLFQLVAVCQDCHQRAHKRKLG